MAQSLRQKSLDVSRGQPALRWKLVGNWRETMKIVEKLGPSMKDASLKAQMKLGQQIVDKVKGHLRDQDLPWAPSSDRTEKAKSHYGLHSRTLIAWGNYYNAIKVWRVGSQKSVLIGVRPGLYTYNYRGKKSKIDIARIAAIHEFSTGRRVPRRPLWNPTIKEMGGAKGFKNLYITSLKAHLRRHGIPFKHLNL